MREWCNTIETVLNSYVDADDALMYSIICSVVRYCVYYPCPIDMSLCASYASKVFGLF